MKAVQVMLDEELLALLDRDEEVQRDGRSAVLRRAAAAYLRAKRDRAIAAAYQKGYGESEPDELDGWEREGVWPDR